MGGLERLVFLVILSSVLLSSSVSPEAQGIVAVIALVGFVICDAFGLGAGNGQTDRMS